MHTARLVQYGLAAAIAASFAPAHASADEMQGGIATTEETQAGIGLGSAARAAEAVHMRFSPVQNALDLPGAPVRGTAAQGMAAGDGLAGWSGWGSLGFTSDKNTFAATAKKSSSQTLSLGMDRALGDKITGGVLLSISHDSTDTTYNGGNIKTLSATIAPYASFQLNDWLSADLSAGVGTGHADQSRVAFGTTVTGSYRNTTVFGTASLKASKWYDSTWLLSGTLGIIGSRTERSGFTESDGTVNDKSTSRLIQSNIGGTVGYWASPALLYATANYVYDIKHPAPTVIGASNDRDELQVSLGAQFYGQDKWENLTGGLSLSHTMGRSQRENTSLNLSARLKF